MALGQHSIGEPPDWRESARTVLEVAQVAASIGVIAAVGSHLGGASGPVQAWLSAGAAGLFVLLRTVRMI